LTQYFVESGNGFYNVKNRAFSKLFQKIAPKLSVPEEGDLVFEKLPLLYENMKEAVDRLIQDGTGDMKSVAISATYWIDASLNTHLCHFLHYLDKNWTRSTVLLSVESVGHNFVEKSVQICQAVAESEKSQFFQFC